MNNTLKNFNELVEYIQYSILILKKSPHLHRYVVDGIRNNIFYMSQTKEFFSGLYSKQAFEQVFYEGNHTKLCKEHHFGLKGLTERIIEMNLSNDDMKQFIKDNATYNFTTKEENLQLKSHRQSYEKCGIELNTFMGWVQSQYKELETQNSPSAQYTKFKIKMKYEQMSVVEHSWWG